MKGKSKGKNPQDSTKLELISKDCSYLDYLSDNSGRLFPDKEGWRLRLRYTMLCWADENDKFEIEQFCREYQIPRRTLYFWRDKYPDIRQTIDDIRVNIGSTRRIGALTRKLDKDVVFKDIHKYDPEWLDINKYHNDLKKDLAVSAAANAKIIADEWSKIMDGDSEK